MGKEFVTKVRGVSHENPDGTSRQKILPKCKKSEIVRLVREPDNPYDPFAIGVYREKGEQIGYISKDIAFRGPMFNDLAYHMDNDGEVKAEIIEITGGRGFFGFGGKNYGCVIKVFRGGIPHKDTIERAKEHMQDAKSCEKSDVSKAIRLYVKAINEIREAEKLYYNTMFYKKTAALMDYGEKPELTRPPMPINRLTLLLEKKGLYEQCLDVIQKYERFNDRRGLSASDLESIRKRKERILKKTS
jgi:hypothetical protein